VINLANENPLPIDKVLEMRRAGMSDQDIASDLMSQGYSAQQAADSIGQADIKTTIEDEAPSPEMRPSMINEESVSDATPMPVFQQEARPPVSRQSYSTVTLSQRPSDRNDAELIEQIAETIIDEKWQKVTENIGDLAAFKENVSLNLTAIKQEMLRMQGRFDSLQRGVLGKIHDYDTNIADVGTEIKALEKVLQKIMDPLTSNIKDLQKITDKLRDK